MGEGRKKILKEKSQLEEKIRELAFLFGSS